MTRPSADALLPKGVRARHIRHHARHDQTLRRFRLAIQEEFEGEVERMCRNFTQNPLQAQAEPVVTALRDYMSWLGWCAWCSSHLAPPLDLAGEADAKRMAAALVVYCGPRLIDDAIDDHRTYKNMRQTLLDKLIQGFPNTSPATLRCQVALLGSWVLIYGMKRLRRQANDEAARRTLNLCEQIAPGAVLETLNSSPLTWEQYRQIVLLKAVYYDQILYRNLLDPVPNDLKRSLLEIAARISSMAQYLNDFRDQGDDRSNGRKNLLEWFHTEDDFWDFCRSEAEQTVMSLEQIPQAVGDAFAAALIETFDSAARMQPPEAKLVMVS